MTSMAAAAVSRSGLEQMRTDAVGEGQQPCEPEDREVALEDAQVPGGQREHEAHDQRQKQLLNHLRGQQRATIVSICLIC